MDELEVELASCRATYHGQGAEQGAEQSWVMVWFLGATVIELSGERFAARQTVLDLGFARRGITAFDGSDGWVGAGAMGGASGIGIWIEFDVRVLI